MRAFIIGLAIGGTMLAGCASATFEISRREQIEDVERIRAGFDAELLAMGGSATYPAMDYSTARCRWSATDPALAVCRTRRTFLAGPWKPVTVHYRRDDRGRWVQVERRAS